MPNPENLIPAKPGEVRNPNGKPKGTLNRSTLYRKWLEVSDDKGLTEADKVALAQIEKAKMGDTQAAKEVFDSSFGKIADKSEISGADGGPIQTSLQDSDRDIITRYLQQKDKS